LLAALLASVPLAAAAQIPSSDQPGRERQRFTAPPDWRAPRLVLAVAAPFAPQ